MTKLYLHIGYPRTGTTSLQLALNGARDRLAEAKIFWPGVLGGYRHRYLQVLGAKDASDKIRKVLGLGPRASVEKAAEAWLEDLAQKSSDFHLTVMSEETVVMRSKDELKAMHEMLAPHFSEIRAFVCFRPHRSYLESNFRQRLRTSFSDQTLESYGRAHLEHPFFNYAQRLRGLNEVFGADNVLAFEYQTGASESSNHRILQAMACAPHMPGDIPEGVNESVDWRTLELKRLVNAGLNKGFRRLRRDASPATHVAIYKALGEILEATKPADNVDEAPQLNHLPPGLLKRWDKDWAQLTGNEFARQFGRQPVAPPPPDPSAKARPPKRKRRPKITRKPRSRAGAKPGRRSAVKARPARTGAAQARRAIRRRLPRKPQDKA